jgi:hypothetical protein
VHIEHTVTEMNTNNIRNIESSVSLVDEAKRQTWKILDIMHDDLRDKDARIVFNDSVYTRCLDVIRQNAATTDEKCLCDTLFVAYHWFKRRTHLLDTLFISGTTGESNETLVRRSQWFNTLYRPVYESLTEVAGRLESMNQSMILDNASELKSNFYRMVIPLIVAIAVGIFLIVLFNYFLNIYFLNPILRIIKGIKDYTVNKHSYNVKIDTRDEIHDLNREIKSLIANTKQKESTGVFNFNK